jgi:starch phosphorylase
MHTYSGGRGVLAGDTARSAADLELPAVFVTLVSRKGYLRQEVDSQGHQIEHADPWDPAAYATALRSKVAIPIGNREVWIRPWLHILTSPLGHSIPVLLLDTDLPENAPEDRGITDFLYGGDIAYRLKQEIVLGIGGLRLLQALGFNIRTYHLNEGHASLLALDLPRRYPLAPDQVGPGDVAFDIARVKYACIFTTHTPVEAGHDQFPYELVTSLLGNYVDMNQLRLLAGQHSLNMTRLGLRLSGYVNGVAQRHAQTTQGMFPGYRIRAVTNGVHVPTWTHPSFARLYDQYVPAWAYEPEMMVRADQIPDQAMWTAHQDAKRDLIGLIAKRTGRSMDPDVPLIGFARRMTAYKRPDMLFSDIERLSRIAQKHPFQIVMAGKAHPRDTQGKALIETVNTHLRALGNKVPGAFLDGYDLTLAKTLIAGVDVWLNNPIPPMEASGTSGMKAAVNGVLNLSVLDGWWVEAWIEGVTGWSIGADGAPNGAPGPNDLYDKLDSAVLPIYYDDRTRWIWMMKQSIAKIAYYFNSQRMMRRYASEAYLI